MAEVLQVNPFDFVVFGGTGDLAMRKLLPGLYYRERDRQMTDESRIIAVSRTEQTVEDFRGTVWAALQRHVPAADLEPAVWERFSARLSYVSLDATKPAGWEPLQKLLKGHEGKARVCYLATAPSLFGAICRNLQAAGLVTDTCRVVLEKPIGHDGQSANAVNEEVGAVFPEDRIYRIDHYLGKESVQNLMVLRFGNALFEPLWNSSWIDHIQITVAESVGVEGRAEYYDKAGALRDMVQNHFLQLLCLVAMEPPAHLSGDQIRNEKIKVLRALRPITQTDVKAKTVRGQYRAGSINGQPVPGYADELTRSSNTETLVAIKAEIENWRWSGVPFYLRTGKRLPVRYSEIVVQFKDVPHSVFPKGSGDLMANRLVIRLQPDEGVQLNIMTKVPGPGGLRLRSVPLNLSYAEAFKDRYPEAYERLLMDVVRGNPSLFMRRDEVDAAWSWIDTILAGWEQTDMRPDPYAAGGWGPISAALLLDRDGRRWHDPEL
ncbi:glucose-6-phosphate dehydrogenase [Nitrospirillum sp. BR 11752]|uniref:glucose-6-phosphate dehydrogenase n=1 Tax=Nitrospirillum sp. BR 11752 TaxID=3104293 RepID=UPI002EA5307E|nr:glucose-6-phosphate dehydrogenase [Nitrospirillum sp. BR 11752]